MKSTGSRKRINRPNGALFPARPMKLWSDSSLDQQEVRIEIVPMIDVIFCILTFFILAAVNFSRQQAISLDLPKAQTGTPQMRDILVVSLDDFGQIYVEQQPIVSRNQLYQRLEQYHQDRPSGVMVLHASKESSYNDVIQVLDILREVGGERVALATLPGESEPLPNGTINSTPSNPLNSFPSTPEQSQFNPSATPLNPGQSQFNPSATPLNPGQSQFNPSNPSVGVPAAPN
jgi:biopolymer transport protein ExbD